MSDISKQGIIRLARKAGVKSLSNKCVNVLKEIMCERIEELLKIMIIFNENKSNKIILLDDLVKTLEHEGINLCSI